MKQKLPMFIFPHAINECQLSIQVAFPGDIYVQSLTLWYLEMDSFPKPKTHTVLGW